MARRRTSPPVWVTVWLLVWMGTGLLSTLIHGISITTTFVSYRWMFLPTVLYMASARYGRERGFARNLIGVVVTVGLLQAAVAIVQAVVARSIGDTSFGLLGPGGANILGFLILLAVVLLVAGSTPISRSVWPIILGILGIIAAQARGALFTLPFAFVLAYRERLTRRVAVLGLVAVLAASGLVVVVAFQTSHMDVFHEMSPAYIVRAQLQNPDRGGGRLLPLEKLPGIFGSSPVAWTIGLGPGRYGSAWHQIWFMRKYATSVANSEWTVISGEYGLVGLLCFLAILIRPLRLSRRRSRLRDDLAWARQIALAAPSIVLIGALGMAVGAVLEYQPFSYPWWALLGLLEAACAGVALAKPTEPAVLGPERRCRRNDARGRLARSVTVPQVELVEAGRAAWAVRERLVGSSGAGARLVVREEAGRRAARPASAGV